MTGRMTVKTYNSTVTSCLLCHSSNTAEVTSLRASDICRLYRRHFDIDPSSLLSAGTIYLRKCLACGLICFDPPDTGNSEFYDRIQRNNSYYMESKHEYHVALAQIREGDNVLEVGAGSGNFAKLLKNNQYTGLELSSKAVKAANDGRIILQSIQNHAISHPEAYDVVCLFQVLEHITDPRQFLEDCIRCIKTGGKLIIALPSSDSIMGTLINFPLDMPPHHVTRWPDSVLRNMGKLLPLQLLLLQHEPLPPRQIRFIRRSGAIARIYKLFNRPMPLIDFSLFKKCSTSIAVLASLVGLPAVSTDSGVHVTAVYRKG